MTDSLRQIFEDVLANGPWVIERHGKPKVVIISHRELEALRSELAHLERSLDELEADK